MWPTSLLEDFELDKRHQVFEHTLVSDPSDPDPVSFLVDQGVAHVGQGGTAVRVVGDQVEVLEILIDRLPDGLQLVLDDPIPAHRFRALAKRAAARTLEIRQPVPDPWIDAALLLLGRLDDTPFVDVQPVPRHGRPGLLARSPGMPELWFSTEMVGAGWKFAADRSLSAAERKWLSAMRKLLQRSERTAIDPRGH
jgi:hypothetical protein